VFDFLKKIFGRKKSNRETNSPRNYHSLESFLIYILEESPNDLMLYQKAFTHSSKSKNPIENLDRLEFLGDAVLGQVIAVQLYHHFPHVKEGDLTSYRSKLVNRKFLNQIGLKMGFKNLAIASAQGKEANSIMGDIMEALIGAIYLDKGYEKAEKFIQDFILTEVDLDTLPEEIISYKSKVIEMAAQQKKKIKFALLSETGLEHQKIFEIGCLLEGEVLARAKASSKKNAQELVAEEVYKSGILEKENHNHETI
jgi:ribonuclease-3